MDSNEEIELTAQVLVDQHYAAGPAAMKKAIAEALAAAAAGRLDNAGTPRERLEKEVDEAIATSARGSE